VELDARARRAVGVQRDQHLSHAFIRARLRHDLQHEAQAIAVDEDLFIGEVGGVGQPRCELLCRCVRRCAKAHGFEQAWACGPAHGASRVHGDAGC